MLCHACKSINIDALIPPQSALEAGTISGTTQHATFGALQEAARDGCALCAAINDCAPRLRRMQGDPVELKMQLRGHANAWYEGGCRLFVSCGAVVIARLEVCVARGR